MVKLSYLLLPVFCLHIWKSGSDTRDGLGLQSTSKVSVGVIPSSASLATDLTTPHVLHLNAKRHYSVEGSCGGIIMDGNRYVLVSEEGKTCL